MKFIKPVLNRLPDSQSIRSVFAVIVTLVYSWTLFVSFHQLPSWLFYLNIGEILSLYAYSFAIDLLDSLLLLVLVLLLEMTVFILANKEKFQSRAITIVVTLLGSLMLRLSLFPAYEDVGVFVSGELIWWALTFLLGLALILVVQKTGPIRNLLNGFASRAVVFLYIYIPLSFIALVIVVFRNVY
jgi:hypothetical protein